MLTVISTTVLALGGWRIEAKRREVIIELDPSFYVT